MPQYCLVKHRISTYVIDGADSDRNPDRVPVTGVVTFEPLLDKGDSVVVTEDGVATTITLTPIEAHITNGEIYHRGEEGVKLFAGGPDTNPEKIRYKATFHNLIASGNRIELKNILFEAIPGGELTLSMAQPVPGKPYPGYSSTIEAGITQISDAAVAYLDQIGGARDEALGQVEGAVGTALSSPMTPERTTFFEMSTNLANPTGVLADSRIVTGQGEITPSNSGAWVTAPIPVVGGQEYTLYHCIRATFYDEDGQYAGNAEVSASDSSLVTAPPSARTVRLTVAAARLESVQMNLGPALLPYEPWREPYLPASILELPDTPDLPDEPWFTVTPDDTSFFKTSPNLANPTGALADSAIPAGTGEIGPSDRGSWVTAPIPVTGGQEYSIYHYIRATFYDAAGQYVGFVSDSGSQPDVVTAPPSATTVRLTVTKGRIDSMQMNLGPALLPLEPWREPYIPANMLELPHQDPLDPFVVDITGLDEEFTGPELDVETAISQDSMADVYARYDALVAAHPDYVTRRDLGLASDGVTHIYAYTLRPEEVPGTHYGEVDSRMVRDLPTGVILSGVHGYEKPAVSHLHRLATMLCEEWEEHPPLEALRWNFELILVPLANPTGWESGARHNVNGVDLNRNYPTGWIQGEPGTSTYGGPEPLSEPESQAIYALLQEVQERCVFGLDLHNFSTPPGQPWTQTWQPALDPLCIRVGKAAVSLLSRRWRARHEWITVPDKFLGYVSPPSPGGTFGSAMVGLGIPGSTYETSRLTRLDGGPASSYSARAMTLGFEATVTVIAMTARESVRSKRGIPLD